jgi:hypothetical protein
LKCTYFKLHNFSLGLNHYLKSCSKHIKKISQAKYDRFWKYHIESPRKTIIISSGRFVISSKKRKNVIEKENCNGRSDAACYGHLSCQLAVIWEIYILCSPSRHFHITNFISIRPFLYCLLASLFVNFLHLSNLLNEICVSILSLTVFKILETLLLPIRIYFWCLSNLTEDVYVKGKTQFEAVICQFFDNFLMIISYGQYRLTICLVSKWKSLDRLKVICSESI